jgi:hypothetical protein
LIVLNAQSSLQAYAITMEEAYELARLERRIAEVRCAIEQAQHGHGWSGNAPERERMLALLKATLRALEARKAALEKTSR